MSKYSKRLNNGTEVIYDTDRKELYITETILKQQDIRELRELFNKIKTL